MLEKGKKFVKDHKKEIVAFGVGSAATVGAYTLTKKLMKPVSGCITYDRLVFGHENCDAILATVYAKDRFNREHRLIGIEYLNKSEVFQKLADEINKVLSY